MEVIKEENKKIILMIDDKEYFMSIRGNKIIVTKIKENENSVDLTIQMVDVVLADDLCSCIDFLTKSCFTGRDVYMEVINYPNHVKRLLEDGYSIIGKNLYKNIPKIKEKERG